MQVLVLLVSQRKLIRRHWRIWRKGRGPPVFVLFGYPSNHVIGVIGVIVVIGVIGVIGVIVVIVVIVGGCVLLYLYIYVIFKINVLILIFSRHCK